jgi:ADP-heptose:LPS heptosyltransferase
MLPFVERFIPYNKERIRGSGPVAAAREFAGCVRTLRSFKYDLAVDFQGLTITGLLTFLSGAKRKVGFRWKSEPSFLFYDRVIDIPRGDVHAVERNMFIAGELCLNIKKAAPVFLEDLKFRAETSGIPAAPFAVFATGPRWDTKRWPSDRFAALADRLHGGLGMEVVLVGGNSDAHLNAEVKSIAKSEIIDLTGRTDMPGLMGVLQSARLIVGVDTGPLHLGAALGTPVVGLFGPTAPLRTGPYGNGHMVIRSGIECSPCFKKECNEIKCMEGISVDDVFDVARSIILSESRGSEGQKIQ